MLGGKALARAHARLCKKADDTTDRVADRSRPRLQGAVAEQVDLGGCEDRDVLPAAALALAPPSVRERVGALELEVGRGISPHRASGLDHAGGLVGDPGPHCEVVDIGEGLFAPLLPDRLDVAGLADLRRDRLSVFVARRSARVLAVGALLAARVHPQPVLSGVLLDGDRGGVADAGLGLTLQLPLDLLALRPVGGPVVLHRGVPAADPGVVHRAV